MQFFKSDNASAVTKANGTTFFPITKGRGVQIKQLPPPTVTTHIQYCTYKIQFISRTTILVFVNYWNLNASHAFCWWEKTRGQVVIFLSFIMTPLINIEGTGSALNDKNNQLADDYLLCIWTDDICTDMIIHVIRKWMICMSMRYNFDEVNRFCYCEAGQYGVLLTTLTRSAYNQLKSDETQLFNHTMRQQK